MEVEVEVSVTILSLASWGTAARKSADRQRAPEHQLTTGLLEIDMGKADADMSSLNEYVFYNPCQFLNSSIGKYFSLSCRLLWFSNIITSSLAEADDVSLADLDKLIWFIERMRARLHRNDAGKSNFR